MMWTDLVLVSLHFIYIYETTVRPSFRPLCITDACRYYPTPFFPFLKPFQSTAYSTYSTLKSHYSGSRSYRGGSDTHKSIETAVCDSIYERNT